MKIDTQCHWKRQWWKRIATIIKKCYNSIDGTTEWEEKIIYFLIATTFPSITLVLRFRSSRGYFLWKNEEMKMSMRRKNVNV
jgi:hypothetical protein